MEDLYGTAATAGGGLGSESEDIANILNQLLQSSSSSSSPFCSAPSSSSSSVTAFKAKYTHLLHSPPPPQPHHQPPSFSDAATVSELFVSEERLRFGRSENRTEPEPSTAAGSSGFGFSDPSGGGFFGAEVRDGAAENALSKGRRVSPENDFGDFSCDSEGPEASDVPSNSAQPQRGSSKRSRAAEVHNLSEKRRRSRINEKMKALQNLIPNSNKTDKASMLDEAIEYLKQLQLQVQMLSMRNGLNLHPICLPGVLQPMQLPISQTGLGFNESIKFPNPGIGISTSVHEETLTQPNYNLPNSCNISNQPLILSSLPNVPNPETTLQFERSTQTHFRPVNLTPSSAELCDKRISLAKSDTLPSKSPDV